MATNESKKWVELVKEALNGRCEGLFEEFDPSLRKIAGSLVPNKDLDDVIQAAHIRIWRCLEEIDLGKPETIKTFLYRLSVNAIRTESKKISKGDITPTLADPLHTNLRGRLRLYYSNHREKIKKKRRERYKANPQRERIQQKEYYGRRKDKTERMAILNNVCRVYVAGPISKNEKSINRPIDNVKQALQVALRIRKYGYTPFVPHLYHFWDLLNPQSYEYWIKMDIEWLVVCDVLFRMGGASRGAEGEIKVAQKIAKMPVVYSIPELLNRCPIDRVGGDPMHSILLEAEDTFDFVKKEFGLK